MVWGKPLAAVLSSLGVAPDFEYSGAAGALIDTIHRRDGQTEIYFVANQKDRPEELECSFRVSGKAPEFWYPDTGRREKTAAYVQKSGRTTLPLRLDPYGSVFVVFRGPAAASSIVTVRRDGTRIPADVSFTSEGRIQLNAWETGGHELTTASGKTLRAAVSGLGGRQPVAGSWELRFPPKWGAPEKVVLEDLVSWTLHGEDGVKHFSGTATYVKDLHVAAEWVGKDRLIHLDLGKVMVIAEVRVNGKDLGVLWKPPFRVGLTGAVNAGANRIEIRVTNLWPNRMIGDRHLPENKRFTWSTWNPYNEASPLLESGLIGPVTVITGKRVWL